MTRLTADDLQSIRDQTPSETARKCLDELFDGASAVKENSYSPYSKFRVGSALLLANGEIISGCNVENASYGATICAERSAITTLVVTWHRAGQSLATLQETNQSPQSAGHRSFDVCAVVTDLTDTFCAPCGPCRQCLREFAPSSLVVSFMADRERGYRVWTLGELLPDSFGPADLERPRK